MAALPREVSLVFNPWPVNCYGLDKIIHRTPDQIRQRPIGSMHRQFRHGVLTGGHRQNFRSNRAAAFNVKRGVPDDQDFVTFNLPSRQHFTPDLRHQSDFIAVVMVVGKSARDKRLPQIEMAQLDLRAEPDVPGEQPKDGRIRHCLKLVEKIVGAATYPAIEVMKIVGQPVDVTGEKPVGILGRLRDPMPLENLAGESGVGATRKLHVLDAIAHIELIGEGAGKSLHAGPAALDQRSVDVE